MSTRVRRRAPALDDGACTHPEPWPTKDTACVGLIGAAERAATAEPEALEAWADDEAEPGLHVASQRDRSRGTRTTCRPNWPSKEGATEQAPPEIVLGIGPLEHWETESELCVFMD